MDTLYKIKLDHMTIDSKTQSKILPKSKEKMRKIIINCNIIVSALFRCKGIFMHNKQKEDMDFELKNKIKFTKGYVICINPETVDKMKFYEYYRKTISNRKTLIKVKESNMKVQDYFNNSNYSEPI
jgi:hypothetical protein